jgi:xylulokinase
MKWMLDAQEKKIATSNPIRFVGGGALSSLTCQILADILNRKIETVPNPQNVGSVGAAIVAAVGLGMIGSLEQAEELIHISETFLPRSENRLVYDQGYRTFQQLYLSNKKNFSAMNR